MIAWTVAHRVLCPWNSPGKNTGVGCHSLLQGLFPAQGSNPGLLYCRQIFYHLSHWGSHWGSSEYNATLTLLLGEWVQMSYNTETIPKFYLGGLNNPLSRRYPLPESTLHILETVSWALQQCKQGAVQLVDLPIFQICSSYVLLILLLKIHFLCLKDYIYFKRCHASLHMLNTINLTRIAPWVSGSIGISSHSSLLHF